MVFNPVFQDDTLNCSPGCSYQNITGWVTGPQTGVFKASTSSFPEAPASGLYNSGASPAQLGQPLQIFVKSVGHGQVDSVK